MIYTHCTIVYCYTLHCIRIDGGKIIADAAAAMGHRRRNKMGVRASMNEAATSDAEAAARVSVN